MYFTMLTWQLTCLLQARYSEDMHDRPSCMYGDMLGMNLADSNLKVSCTRKSIDSRVTLLSMVKSKCFAQSRKPFVGCRSHLTVETRQLTYRGTVGRMEGIFSISG